MLTRQTRQQKYSIFSQIHKAGEFGASLDVNFLTTYAGAINASANVFSKKKLKKFTKIIIIAKPKGRQPKHHIFWKLYAGAFRQWRRQKSLCDLCQRFYCASKNTLNASSTICLCRRISFKHVSVDYLC